MSRTLCIDLFIIYIHSLIGVLIQSMTLNVIYMLLPHKFIHLAQLSHKLQTGIHIQQAIWHLHLDVYRHLNKPQTKLLIFYPIALPSSSPFHESSSAILPLAQAQTLESFLTPLLLSHPTSSPLEHLVSCKLIHTTSHTTSHYLLLCQLSPKLYHLMSPSLGQFFILWSNAFKM